jgi:hypothetical protein
MNFLQYKIIGAPKKFKNQPRPLVRPSSVNFCQTFGNLSRETVPLSINFGVSFALFFVFFCRFQLSSLPGILFFICPEASLLPLKSL